MTRQTTRKLNIKCRDQDAFGLFSVVDNARSVSPYDVKAACDNLRLECEGKVPPLDVVSLVNYVLTGYFTFAHQSGLYNSQRELWESIARITSLKINVVSQGFFIPIKMPVVDIDCVNNQGDLIVLARLVKSQKRKDFDRRAIGYLTSFIQRINKVQSKKNTLTGAFISVPSPAPPGVIMKVKSRVASDLVSRFESRLPMPANIPLNVVEMDYGENLSASGEWQLEGSEDRPMLYRDEQLYSVRMVQPELANR